MGLLELLSELSYLLLAPLGLLAVVSPFALIFCIGSRRREKTNSAVVAARKQLESLQRRSQ